MHCKKEDYQQKQQTVSYPRGPKYQIPRWQGGTSQRSDLLEMSKLVAACVVFRVMCPGSTRFHKAHLTLSRSTQSPVTITMCAPIRRYVFRGLSCATTGDQPARAGPRDNKLPQQAQQRPPTAPYSNNLHMSSHIRNTFAKAIGLFSHGSTRRKRHKADDAQLPRTVSNYLAQDGSCIHVWRLSRWA